MHLPESYHIVFKRRSCPTVVEKIHIFWMSIFENNGWALSKVLDESVSSSCECFDELIEKQSKKLKRKCWPAGEKNC